MSLDETSVDLQLQFNLRGKLLSVSHFRAIHPIVVEIRNHKCKPRSDTTDQVRDQQIDSDSANGTNECLRQSLCQYLK